MPQTRGRDRCTEFPNHSARRARGDTMRHIDFLPCGDRGGRRGFSIHYYTTGEAEFQARVSLPPQPLGHRGKVENSLKKSREKVYKREKKWYTTPVWFSQSAPCLPGRGAVLPRYNQTAMKDITIFAMVRLGQDGKIEQKGLITGAVSSRVQPKKGRK